jgi:photosynthetic reaction center H subunit
MGAITEYIDLTLLLFNVFFLLFLGLVAYLHRESKREGYPLVNDRHQPVSGGLFGMPGTKTYLLPDGTSMSAPHARDANVPNYGDTDTSLGMNLPITPTGNPMLQGVGPGTYTQRRDVSDLTFDGKVRIQPLRAVPHAKISDKDPDLRGMGVFGCDGKGAGHCVDVWIDISETMIRFIEVEVANSTKRALIPINMIDINKSKREIDVDAIRADQFADIPSTKSPDRVTLLEEERIHGYLGAGYLYATPWRAEPVL